MAQKLNEKYIGIVLALISVLIGFVLENYIENLTKIDSLYIGFFTYLLINMYFLQITLNSIDINILKTKEVIDFQHKVSSNNSEPFDLFWELCLIKAREGLYHKIDSNSFIVKDNYIPSFWQQAVANTMATWHSTSITNPDDESQPWERRGVELHKLSIEEFSIQVKRIFIFKDKNMANDKNYREIMNFHKSRDINVKYLTLDNEIQKKELSKVEKIIGSKDFTLIDGKYLLVFNLADVTNELISIKCSNNEKILRELRQIYPRLWEKSNHLITSKNVVKKK